MINFGDVFKFENKSFVYLMQTGDLIFAAKILEVEEARLLKRMYEAAQQREKKLPPGAYRPSDGPVYSFVVLSTDDFVNMGAHYGAPPLNTDIRIDICGKLCNEDVEMLKEEIMADSGIAIALRERITALYKK